MRLPRKRFVSLVLILLIISAAGFGYWHFRGTRQRANGAVTASRQGVPVQRRTIAQTISSSGRIAANRDLQLYFDTAGKVKRIAVARGKSVKVGDVIAELENESQRLAHLNAIRQYEMAKLESPPSIIEEERLRMQLAEKDLKATVLKAPFDGIIADLLVQEGESVTTSKAVVRLIDTSKYFIEVNVDEVDIRFVEPNQPAAITLDAYPDLVIDGKVVEIGIVPISQGDLILFPVRIELEEVDTRVRPGMSAEAKITVALAEQVLCVPLEAVAEVNGRSIVTVVTSEGLRPRPVQTGLSDGLFVEITQGLQENERVLASNHDVYRTLVGGGFAPNTGAGAFRMQLPVQQGGGRR